MVEIFVLIIWIFSLLGILVISLPKIPHLSLLIREKESYTLNLKRRIINLSPFKNFRKEIFLQKIIAKIRIFSLKVDNLTFFWLRKLREREEKEKKEKDRYWDEIKKAKIQK